MENKKIFDGITIFLIIVLAALVVAIFGMTFWKEKNVEVQFGFYDQLKSSKETNEIVKGDSIFISFSGPVQKNSVLENLIIEPQLDFQENWNSEHELQLELKSNLVPDFNYQVKIEKFRSKWGLENETKISKFSTDPLPKLKNISPSQDEEEFGVGGKIVFEFEQSLPSQYYLKIKTTPEFEFKSVKSGSRDKIIVQPTVNLSYDTNYQITAEVKSQNYLDFSRKIGATSFKTERPPVVVYGWNSDGSPTKTEFRTELIEPVIKVGRYIDIDLSDQNMYLFEDGREEGAFKVSTGLRGMDTPTGEFKVMGRSKRPWSAKYGLYMPWFIQFTNQGHGIHELPEWPGGYKEGTNHLGIPVSHGCVRLGVGPAKKVYDFVETGTPLVIHY